MRHSVDVPVNDVLNKSRWKGGLPWKLWLVVIVAAGAVMAQIDVFLGALILVFVPIFLIAFFKQDPDIVGLSLCSVAQRSYYDPASVPVQLKVGFWAKEKGKSCRRNYQEQDDEARATKLERRGKDPGVAPAFDRENSYLESL